MEGLLYKNWDDVIEGLNKLHGTKYLIKICIIANLLQPQML